MIEFTGQKGTYKEYATGDRAISFIIYDSNTEAIQALALAKPGTEFKVVLYPTDDFDREETEDETKSRFKKQMEALITDIAAKRGIPHEEYRNQCKEAFKQMGWIKESTNEMGIEQLSLAIAKLKEKLNENN